ncbi:hypothetical protein HYH03_001060 [Edaphochlamys debaryana]|uniref:Dephospho-CoA kinase n=1 Tax=Edaphochlamys debaryana TaxID=47281 RepID=A0A836C6L2_9CHLO|nr:hypothetical protein HYH03_001060 [Edaphochlamys debaryana]|eukprot:KAG2501253.1 hypothetical protein HYH03_001060 [Edaphochlamys debaryana]
MARDGGTQERALARIRSQMPLDAKRRLAGIVVENDGTEEELREKVGRLVERLRTGSRLWGLLTSPLVLALGAVAGVAWGRIR